VGQMVTGVVTKLTDFGAFAALEDGIEGLIHITELAEVAPRHPSEVIARGAELPLLVVKVDSRRRRMGLSLKRVSEEEWYQWEEERRVQAEEQLEVDEAPVPEEPPPEPAEGLGEAEVEAAQPAEDEAADDEEPQEEAIAELAAADESEAPDERAAEQPEEDTVAELALSEEAQTPDEAADEQPEEEASPEESEPATEAIDQPAATVPDEGAEASE